MHAFALSIGIGIALLAVAVPASAHYLWIERQGDGRARLYFGEYQDNEREKAGGRLDEIRDPRAWFLDRHARRRELTAAKRADHFDLGPVNATAAVFAEESGYEVRDWTRFGYGVAKPMFYARYATRGTVSAQEPQLALDIVPLDAQRLRVTFRGSPLAKVKLTVFAPNGWTQERRTDEAGEANIATPWPGQYVVEVIHLERRPGEFEGKSYENLRHRMTLSVLKSRSAPRKAVAR